VRIDRLVSESVGSAVTKVKMKRNSVTGGKVVNGSLSGANVESLPAPATIDSRRTRLYTPSTDNFSVVVLCAKQS